MEAAFYVWKEFRYYILCIALGVLGGLVNLALASTRPAFHYIIRTVVASAFGALIVSMVMTTLDVAVEIKIAASGVAGFIGVKAALAWLIPILEKFGIDIQKQVVKADSLLSTLNASRDFECNTGKDLLDTLYAAGKIDMTEYVQVLTGDMDKLNELLLDGKISSCEHTHIVGSELYRG